MRKREEVKVYFDEIETVYTRGVKRWKYIYSWLDAVALAIVIALVFSALCFRSVSVNDYSMKPTLYDGDRLLVSCINMEYRRGDVVVITHPDMVNEPLIKRIIAVEGDVVDIDFADGVVKINGDVIQESYIAAPTTKMSDVAFPVTVPEGCVFVMGDNRNDSFDSRSSRLGFADTRYLLGKAQCRFYPFGEWKID